MNEHLPFDEFVKKQFSNYSPHVPSHIWDNIAAKRKSKPKGFWTGMLNSSNMLLLSILLFVAAGTTYILFIKGNNHGRNNIESEKNHSPSVINSSSPQKNKQNVTTVLNKTEGVNQTLVEEINTSGINFKKPLNSTNSPIDNSLVNRSKNDNRSTTTRYAEHNDEINSNVLAVTSSSEKNNRLFSPYIFNNARALTTTKVVTSPHIKLPDCPAIEKNAAGNKKYWELYVGPDYAFESYKSYGDTASTNYLQKRKASTRFTSAFSAGVRYTKVFNNGTSVRTGINYTQVNEKFLYFNPNEIKYVTIITTRVVIRQPGDTIYINDTLQYQQTGTRTKTTYNRYSNVDIPLIVGYELGNGKIHANINAGVIINIYSWYKGDVLDSLYQPVTITTGKSNSVYQFKNNIGAGFIGSVSLYYRMSDNIRLLVEPYFRYNLSPMSKQNLNLQQKYNVGGVRAGIRFDLK